MGALPPRDGQAETLRDRAPESKTRLDVRPGGARRLGERRETRLAAATNKAPAPAAVQLPAAGRAVGPAGIEPATFGLKVRSSTS